MSLSRTSSKFIAKLGQVLYEAELTGPLYKKIKSPKCWFPDSKDYNQAFLIGNGGSASIASHIANDFVKLGYSAISLTDPAVLTCIANDYDWFKVYSEQIKRHGMLNDILIAISSSGKSKNILEAVNWSRTFGMKVITFSGFDSDNPLRGMGNFNYYVPSHNYGIVECAHLAILHSIVNPGDF